MKLETLVLVVSVVLASSAHAAGEETLSFDSFGRVAVLRPEGAPHEVVLFLSGDEGWAAGAKELAGALSARGALVLGVNTPAYLKRLGGRKCSYPAGDLESLSQFAQKKLGLPEYLHPVVVGVASGAALGYASLAEAPPNTFLGVVTLGFSPEVRMSGTLCKGNGLFRQRTRAGTAEQLRPFKSLVAPWQLLVGEQDKVFPPNKVHAFIEGVRDATVTVVPGAGHALSPVAVWKDAVLQAEAELIRRSAPPPPVTTTHSAEGAPLVDVSDLPLIQVTTSKEGGDTLAVLLSGDGGWAGMDRDVASVLAAEGVPVVGWDSLRYFWKRRTPGDTAKDLARVLKHYLADWKKQRVVLVGYSRGADVLPAVLAQLEPEQRKSVQALGLIAPGQNAELEVHVVDLLGGDGGDPILPVVKSLGGLPVVCVYGSDEADDSLCPLLSGVPGAKAVMLEGGHHFGGDYTAVGRAILAPLREGQHL